MIIVQKLLHLSPVRKKGFEYNLFICLITYCRSPRLYNLRLKITLERVSDIVYKRKKQTH